MIELMEPLISVFVFALGLVLGSFLNVCIYRLPLGDSVVHPRSRCPSCEAPIYWYQNVPVVSWLALRGRCARCEARISVRYPVVEMISGLALLTLWLVFGPGPAFPIASFFALSMLALFDPAWEVWQGVAYVMGAQALSGIAKDLTKMSSKSAVKIVTPEGEQGQLFKWVAVLTGSKNALKGLGFFMGSVLLAGLGFSGALFAMAAGLLLVLVLAVLSMPGDLGQAKKKVKFSAILSKSRNINHLSAARFFLFGSRDIWFVVGLPLFLAASLGWSHAEVGGYMASWVIAYGFVQAATPKLLRRSGEAPGASLSRRWIVILAVVTVAIALAVQAGVAPAVVVVTGLLVFGFVFAVNSAVHSYLVLAYTETEHAALNVGFYYMANAGGRLVGTLLSGLTYQWGGLVLCLAVSASFLIASWLLSLPLSEPATSP